MDFVHFGVGPAATLAGFILLGLSPGTEPEEVCTQHVYYDFTAESSPFYPVSAQPGYWHTNIWPGGHPAPTAGFPDLVMAFAADIVGGELTFLAGNSREAAGVFGQANASGAGRIDSYADTYSATKIYVEVGVNFHATVFDTILPEPAWILTVHPLSTFYESFSLRCGDVDGPPSGDLTFRLHWWGGAGVDSVLVATKPRAWADGVHIIRVEMTPSAPLIPGSSNPSLLSNGTARIYFDGVLEYEDTAIAFRPNPAPQAIVNDGYDVGGVGLGHRGFVGGYTYVDFGTCAIVEPPPPIDPPEEGGELPEPVEPLASDLPVGITRIFALLTYGSGSPQSEIAVAETDLNDPDTWYGGHKAAWLLGVSTIDRELSDSLRGVEVTVTVADPDRVFRALATTDTLSGAIMEIFLVSDTVRYALGEPHRRFAGRVHYYRATPNWQFEFVLRDILSEELANLADTPRIPPGRLTIAQFPGMTKDYENKAIPILIGEVSDESETTPQGVVPPIIVAPSINLTMFGGVNALVVPAILSHGAIHPYAFLQGYYNTVDNPYSRIPIPLSAWGTILTAPGQPGWSYVGVGAQNYIDYPTAPASATHRYTPVFFLASDPNVQAFVDGRIQVAFNTFGLTENADGTGRYFSDAPDIYEFLIRNWLYPPHWRFGDYNGTPTLPRGYTIVNHTSVVTSRERLRAFMGSPGGYPVGFMLGRGGEQQTLRHVLTELCHGVLMEQGIDRHGRILLDVEDVNAVSTISLSDIHDIVAGEFSVRVDRSSYRNNAEYVFGYRYLPAIAPLPTPPEGEVLPPVNVGEHNDWSAVGTHVHTAAVAANQGRETAPLQLENFVVRNSDVAQNWAERTIDRLVGPSPSLDGQRIFTLTTSWGHKPEVLAVELGTVIDIDHVEGMGASGYVGQRGRVLRIVDDLQAAKITFEGRVLFGEGSPA